MERTPLTPVEIEFVERVGRLCENGTAYELLGIDLRANKEDVERVYRDYVREWHPDRFFSRDAGELMPQVEDNFVSVTRAYKTLRDDAKRTAYNKDLEQRGVMVPDAGPAVHAGENTGGFEVKLNRGGEGRARIAPTDGYVPPAVERFSPPTPAPAVPAAPAAPHAVLKLKAQIAEQLARAAGYYESGLEDFRAGRFAKAESSLYLATRYDARNAIYADLFRQSQFRARQARAITYVQLAQQAEQYQNVKDAIINYRKAVECDPEDGLAYARLGRLVREHEEDPREALNLVRKAVAKEPRRVEFRVLLAEMYVGLKMEANAVRELQSALDVEPKHEGARLLHKRLKGTGR